MGEERASVVRDVARAVDSAGLFESNGTSERVCDLITNGSGSVVCERFEEKTAALFDAGSAVGVPRRGASARSHFPTPVNRQSAHRHLGYDPGSLSESEAWASEALILSVPSEPFEPEVDQACETGHGIAGGADVLE